MKTLTSLPTQTEVDDYLKRLFHDNKTATFHIKSLTDSVIENFGVSPQEAEVECDYAHGVTSPTTTHIEQLVHWGCVHLLNTDIKRTAPNEYQHVNGPTPELRPNSKRVGEAMVSVKILKDLRHSPEEILCELTHLWDDTITAEAIKRVFHLSV